MSIENGTRSCSNNEYRFPGDAFKCSFMRCSKKHRAAQTQIAVAVLRARLPQINNQLGKNDLFARRCYARKHVLKRRRC